LVSVSGLSVMLSIGADDQVDGPVERELGLVQDVVDRRIGGQPHAPALSPKKRAWLLPEVSLALCGAVVEGRAQPYGHRVAGPATGSSRRTSMGGRNMRPKRRKRGAKSTMRTVPPVPSITVSRMAVLCR
jgi:hypothetical protein